MTLGNILFSRSEGKSCKRFSVFLAFAYLLGLGLGAWVPLQNPEPLVRMVPELVLGPVSLLDLVLIRLLPLLVSAFAVYIQGSWMFVPIAFSKAFLFSFLAVGVQAAFGDAGWLIRWLFTFSELLSLPVLWLLWLLAREPRQSRLSLWIAGFLTVGLTLGDYFAVLPFGLGLLS